MENQEKVWDEIAPNWNKFREVPSPSVIKFLEDKKGKILDLGCGSGRNFSAMKKDIELYAIDFSEKMLKFAEEKSEKLGLKFELKKSKTNEIPFKNNFFDSIICIAVLHCISSKRERIETMKEIYRTLKIGGTAFISTWGMNSPRLKNKEKECFISWSVKNDKEIRKGEREIKQERYTYIYDFDELKEEIEGIGFQIEEIWEERNINVIVKK